MKLRMPDKYVRGIDMTSVDYLLLRDKIAIEAMKDFLLSPKAPADTWASISTNAYDLADSMIKKSNK